MSIQDWLERPVSKPSNCLSGRMTMSLPMTLTITAFERSPDGGKGLARERAFAGRSKKRGKPTRCASSRSGDEGTGAPGAAPVRPDSDLRGRRPRPVRDGRDRLPPRRAPSGPAARRCRCARARDHLDVRRAQHGGAADPRARDRQDLRGRQALEQGAPAAGEDRVRTGWASCLLAWAMPNGSMVRSARAT